MLDKGQLNFQCSSRNMVFLLILLLFTSLGFGPLTDSQQGKSLVGVQHVQVVVQIGVSLEGPTRQGLQEEVEKQLRNSGILVVAENKEQEELVYPSLYIEVAMWKGRSESYIYFVSAHFYQGVQLMRGKQLKTQAATWQEGLIGEGDLNQIRKDVAKVTKIFLAGHKNVNGG